MISYIIEDIIKRHLYKELINNCIDIRLSIEGERYVDL